MDDFWIGLWIDHNNRWQPIKRKVNGVYSLHHKPKEFQKNRIKMINSSRSLTYYLFHQPYSNTFCFKVLCLHSYENSFTRRFGYTRIVCPPICWLRSIAVAPSSMFFPLISAFGALYLRLTSSNVPCQQCIVRLLCRTRLFYKTHKWKRRNKRG